MARLLLCVAFFALGCVDRPLSIDPFADPNGSGGGANGANGSGANGSGNGHNGSGGPNGNNGPPAARLIAPSSTVTVTSRRPHLRWDMTGVAGAAEVDVCADRACSHTLGTATIDASGSAAAPDADLPPGPVFWRVRTSDTTSATWELFVGQRSAPV